MLETLEIVGVVVLFLVIIAFAYQLNYKMDGYSNTINMKAYCYLHQNKAECESDANCVMVDNKCSSGKCGDYTTKADCPTGSCKFYNGKCDDLSDDTYVKDMCQTGAFIDFDINGKATIKGCQNNSCKMIRMKVSGIDPDNYYTHNIDACVPNEFEDSQMTVLTDEYLNRDWVSPDDSGLANNGCLGFFNETDCLNNKSTITGRLCAWKPSNSTCFESVPAPSTTNPSTTNPSTTNPGTTNPSTTNPGTTNPGTTNPGTTNPSTTNPSTTNPSTTNPSTTKYDSQNEPTPYTSSPNAEHGEYSPPSMSTEQSSPYNGIYESIKNALSPDIDLTGPVLSTIPTGYPDMTDFNPAKIPSLGNGIEIGLNAYVGPRNGGKMPSINHQKDSSYSTSILQYNIQGNATSYAPKIYV